MRSVLAEWIVAEGGMRRVLLGARRPRGWKGVVAHTTVTVEIDVGKGNRVFHLFVLSENR
jgi:hypothetical protein